MDTPLIFRKDIFPYSWEIYGLDGKQIASEPSNDLHLAVGSIVEELEDLNLVLKEMKDDRDVNLPFRNPTIG